VVSGDESISPIGILMQRHFMATNVFQTFGHLFSAALAVMEDSLHHVNMQAMERNKRGMKWYHRRENAPESKENPLYYRQHGTIQFCLEV
jgi:hypothetical protein